MIRRVVCTLAIALAVGGCGISEDEEVALGDRYAEEIARELPMVRDPQVNQYVQGVGWRLASRTSRADLDWKFHVVDSDQVNAFAVPGGHIYVNRGLIERIDRYDELAGVLGHEIGHVVLRHSVDQLEKRGRANVVVGVFCTVTGWCDSGITRIAISAAGSAWFARHSRADEAQADSAAIGIVMAAGIDPEGIPAFFETLLEERERQPGLLDDWFGSHPLEEDRVAATQAVIRTLPRRAGLVRDEPDFAAFRQRLESLPPGPALEPAQP